MFEELWNASTEGNVEVVASLLSQTDINLNVNWADEKVKRTSFYRACGHGKLEIVKLFLNDKRTAVNQETIFGISPLVVACIEGHIEIIKCLLQDSRIVLTQMTFNQVSPLFAACEKGRLEIVKLLLKDERIDPNFPSPNGSTPFLISCLYGHLELVQVLLSCKKVDPNRPSSTGVTPLFIACQRGDVSIVRELMNHPRVHANMRVMTGETPLFAAAICGHLTIVKHLIASGKDLRLNSKWSGNGNDVFQEAKLSQFNDIVKILEEYQARPVEVIGRLQRELGILDEKASKIFQYIVLICDDYFQLSMNV